MCTLLCKYYQEEGRANNWADVNCAVAIVSMAISRVGQFWWRHREKSPRFGAIRCRLLSAEQPNPLHHDAGRRDYNESSFFTGTLSQIPLNNIICSAV